MRKAGLRIFAAASLLLAALPGCSDDPPEGKTSTPSVGPYLVRGRTVTVGVKPDQPQVSQQDGSRWDGFEIRLVDYLAGKSGVTPVYIPVVTADRDARLSRRQLQFVVANYSDTPRRRTIAELAGPYMVTPQGVLVRKGDKSIRSFAEMKGRSVCTTTESTSFDALKDAGIHISTQDYFARCVEQLKGQQVDAVSTDLLILYGFQHTSPDLAIALDRIGRPVEVPASGLNKWMVGIQPGDASDCQATLELVRSFLTDNSWELNFNTWFPEVQQTYKDWSTRFKPRPESLGCY